MNYNYGNIKQESRDWRIKTCLKFFKGFKSLQVLVMPGRDHINPIGFENQIKKHFVDSEIWAVERDKKLTKQIEKSGFPTFAKSLAKVLKNALIPRLHITDIDLFCSWGKDTKKILENGFSRQVFEHESLIFLNLCDIPRIRTRPSYKEWVKACPDNRAKGTERLVNRIARRYGYKVRLLDSKPYANKDTSNKASEMILHAFEVKKLKGA